ncbi:MAG: sulfatase [Planctomycetota bacterium]
MPAADAHEERGRVRRRRVAAGFLVGLLLVGLELITDAVLPPSHVRATALDRALVLAPLPFLGGLFGLVFARLWWLGAAFAVVGAGRVGLHLSMGLRAQRMAYAAHWDEILAGLTLLAVLALRFIESRRRLRVGLAVLTVPVALATLSMAAFGYRGDYGPVREGVIQVAAVFMLLVIAPFVPAPPRRTLGLAFAVTAVAAVTGAFAVGHRQDLRDWAFYRTSLADAYVAPIWTRTGPALPTAAPDDAYRKSPYFGTEAQLETSRRLFAERRPRGVLFLTVDAMRHDVIGREVGGRPVTPFLDSLAATGYRFTRCYAPSNITNATFLAIFAGIYPSEILHHPLGVDDMPVVTQRLRDAGVQCRGVFYEVVAAGGIYKDTAENPSLQFEPELLIGQEDFAPEDLAGLLAPEGDGRWFSFAHYMRPHEPYDSAAPEFAAGGSPFERYAAEVRQADDEIRRLIELLAARGLTDDLWIVVSADHGEEFGEHGLTFHGRQLFDESIRVPLIIAGPGVPTGVCDDPVSLIDLAPTLDEIFETGDAEAPPLSGRSLLPFPAGVRDPDRRDAVAAEMPGVKQSMRQRALIARDRKTVLNFERKTLHRFDLRADPGERVNVADGHAAEVRADVAILEALIAGVEAHRADEEFPVDLVEELERLPREELRARVAATGDADLTTAVAYYAPLATPNGARTLAGELEGSGRLDDTRRLLLRLATGERGESSSPRPRRSSPRPGIPSSRWRSTTPCAGATTTAPSTHVRRGSPRATPGSRSISPSRPTARPSATCR